MEHLGSDRDGMANKLTNTHRERERDRLAPERRMSIEQKHKKHMKCNLNIYTRSIFKNRFCFHKPNKQNANCKLRSNNIRPNILGIFRVGAFCVTKLIDER